MPLHKGSENTSALYFSWKNMNFLLYYIEIQRISSQSLFHNHKIKLLIVNVIFNCNNQLSCYRVARAIAWLQLMTTFVHLRWYAVIQNNTWSRLQHEGDKIYNSLSCSSQCQCGPLLSLDRYVIAPMHCRNIVQELSLLQERELNVNFFPRPTLSFLCATRKRDNVRLVLWCVVVMAEKFMQSRKNPNNIFQKITPTFFGSGIPDCSQNGYRRADWIYFMLQ